MLFATLAAAQSGPPLADQQTSALARLRPGNTIRLHLIGNGRVEGQFADRSATALTLAGTPAPVEHPMTAFDSLWIRRTSAKQGAIIGAIPGALGGLILGYAVNEIACKDENQDPCPEAIPVLGLAGAAGGAVLGALIGLAVPRWQRMVP